MSSLTDPVQDPNTGEINQPSDIAASQGDFNCYMSVGAGCGAVATKTCVICRKPMCDRHTSEADSEACAGCMDFASLELKKEPLIDDEGVTHEGAKITPIGLTYRTLTSRICQMDDSQLEAHIDFVKKQVREAEAVLDYRRIDLAASQVELEERGVAKRKNLRMRNVASIANGNKVIGSISDPAKQAKQKQLEDVAKKLKKVADAFGLPCKTPEDLAKIAKIVQGMTAKKA